MPISMNLKVHRVVSMDLQPDFDPDTGLLRWLDIVITDEEGDKDEVTFFAPGDDDIALLVQGKPVEFDNPRRDAMRDAAAQIAKRDALANFTGPRLEDGRTEPELVTWECETEGCTRTATHHDPAGSNRKVFCGMHFNKASDG